MLRRTSPRRTTLVRTLVLLGLALGAILPEALGGGFPRPIELSFQECRFPDVIGVDREGATVTLGIPLTKAQAIPRLSDGRPALGIIGNGKVESWQFHTFEVEDPDDPRSAVLWATLDLVLDQVDSEHPLRGVFVTDGAGKSSGPSVARESDDRIELDTGVARFLFTKDRFAFVDEAWARSEAVLGPGGETGLFVRGDDGVIYSSRWGSSSAEVVRNGPACAHVIVRGDLADRRGESILGGYVCELTAYRGSSNLEGRLTLIAGHEQNRRPLVFDWAHLVAHLVSSEQGFDVEVAGEWGEEIQTTVDAYQSVCTVQYQTDRPQIGAENPNYYPGLPKSDFAYEGNTSAERILQGYRVVKRSGGDDQELGGSREPSRYPDYQVMRVRSRNSRTELTLLNRWSSTDFPTALECGGAGWVSLELWPDELPERASGQRIHYAIPHQASESREFVISATGSSSQSLLDFGRENTFEVEGRFARFEDYGRALFREESQTCLSVAAQDTLYRWMGLLAPGETIRDRVSDVYWDPVNIGRYYSRVSFLEKNRTGGKFNNNTQEKSLLRFLRFGHGGARLATRSYVEYVRSHHFRHIDLEDCEWDEASWGHDYAFVTQRGGSDVEHDWWRSVRLWARLEGDTRLRDEFLDHGRTLKGTNDNLIYYRAMVKGLESLALSASLAKHAWPPPRDPCTGEPLLETLMAKLSHRLQDWFSRQHDASDPYGSEGWVSPWGSALPQSLGNPWLSPTGWPSWGQTAHLERGVKHDHCYSCEDSNCRSWYAAPYGRRLFHEQLACAALATASSVLPAGDPLRTETFLRVSQLGFNIMGICHWSHQTSPCGGPMSPPWTKMGDAAHIWLPPECPEPGYDHHGPWQERAGDGQLSYAYAGEGGRHVLLQYATQRNWEALDVAITKWHEILSAQRFHDGWGEPCPGSTRWQNTRFDANLNDPGHWEFLRLLMTLAPEKIRAAYPAFNPEELYYR